MNAEQKKKLIESIQADAQLCGRYFSDDHPGAYCVIGGMVKSMGQEPKDWFAGLVEKLIGAVWFRNQRAKLCDYYGLEHPQLVRLQMENDGVGHPGVVKDELTAERRKRLLALVETFPVTE